jgi:hypothetical protein
VSRLGVAPLTVDAGLKLVEIVQFSADPSVFAKANRLYQAVAAEIAKHLPAAARTWGFNWSLPAQHWTNSKPGTSFSLPIKHFAASMNS